MTMKEPHILALAVVMLTGAGLVANAQPTHKGDHSKLRYPPARRDSTVDSYFGTTVPAPYQWMENLESPALKQWVEAENTLTFSYLDKIPIRSWIRKRLTTLWNYSRESTPQQVAGGRIFFGKNSGLQNQSVVYVQDSPSTAARQLLDPNALSPDGSIALLGYQPSPHGTHLAYDLSQGGSDWVTIHVRDVATGKDLPDVIRWVKFSGLAWTEDGKGFFYSRYPAPPAGKAISQQLVNQKLYYHRLGTEQSADTLIYARPDLPEWIVGGRVSEDGRYLFVYLVNGTAPQNELFYVDLGDPQKPSISGTPKPLYTKNDATYRVVGHEGKTLFIQTTLDAPKGRIIAASLDDPAPAHWRVVVPERDGVIQGATMAGGRILVDFQVVAKSQLALFSTDGKWERALDLPTLGSVGRVSARQDSKTVYYGFTSFLYPESVYRYDVESSKTEAFFTPDTDFNPTQYDVKQVFFPTKDGTQIPMFIVAKKGVKLDGKNPTILYAYGGFDITITPRFNPVLPLWLEMGGVYAVPNLRGGGTYGEEWHKAGMFGRKQNVFDDFAWAAKYLIAGKYTQSRRLGIQGYSNGGLLVGASITQNPGLFGAAYAGAGVMDMLRYQKFSGGALWAPEYGTADDQKAFHWLYAYSPLANLKKGTCYPPTIITTADHDDRVVPSHSYKFAAKLQHDQGCDNPVLIRVETKTSHNYMPTDKRIAQTADVWAFEAYNLGITEPPAPVPAPSTRH
jgi:prolyl oligopeptidase